MFGSEFHGWWIFPVLMIILCLFIMKGGMGVMMCRPGSRNKDSHGEDAPASALDLLSKRYAQGEISKQEYEEKRSDITRHD